MKLSILALTLLAGVVVSRPPPEFAGLGHPRPPLIPPGFEILPEDAKEKLVQLHFDKTLNFEQRRDGIEKVLDGLPKDVLEKLPLPPGLERLPEESKAKFKDLHMNRELNWRERHELVQKAIKELPEHEQRLVEPPRPPPHFGRFGMPPPHMPPPHMGPPPFAGPDGFPPHPPPGFEAVLSPTIYKQLLTVHANPQLSVAEKKIQIDKIMVNVPQEQLDSLPLPPGFDRLSAENQQRVRQIMHNFQNSWDARHEQVKEFIKALPVEERRLMRPPGPPGVESLPEEVQDQIDELFMNDKLSPMERHMKIQDIIRRLPEEIRSKLPLPPPFMPFQEQQQPEMNTNQEQ